jgi:hypothetical protein
MSSGHPAPPANATPDQAAAHEFLEPIVERLSVPRRIADAMRRIVADGPVAHQRVAHDELAALPVASAA